MIFSRLALALTLCCSQAQAHDQWANGAKIPDWVKASCCGPADAHHLRPDQVTRSDDFYYVEGYPSRIPVKEALPSQDGDYWIFYRDGGGGSQYSSAVGPSSVYCFFVPMAF